MTDPRAAAGLVGWRVLVPRPADRAADLATALERAGAEPVAVPFLTVEPPPDPEAVDLALARLAAADYAWIGLTSVNALRSVTRRAADLGLDPVVPADTRIAAVGPGTARAVRAAGLPVDLVPATGGSAAALGELWPHARPGESVLLPRSDRASSTLPDRLVDKGFAVDAVVTYRTVTGPMPDGVADELRTGSIRAVLLTSPSTVESLRGIELAAGVLLGAIGQPTAEAIRSAGLPLGFVAAEPTAAALVAGLRERAARVDAGPRTTEKRSPDR